MRKPEHRLPCRLERLEDRQLLAVTTQLLDGGATLKLMGDSASESVTITQNDLDDTLGVRWSVLNAGTTGDLPIPIQTFQSSAIKKIIVSLGAGNDQFNYELNGNEVVWPKTLTVDLGAGNDNAFLDFGGNLIYPVLMQGPGDGQAIQPPYQPNPAELKAKLDISVQGGAGNDTIDAIFGNVRANLAYRAQGGAGNDTLSGSIAGVVAAGNTTLFDQDGGAGNDSLWASLDLPGIETGGKLIVNQRGGTDQDTLGFSTYGTIQGLLQINQSGGTGNDTLTSTLLANWTSAGSVQSRILGDAGNDQLHVSLKRADVPPGVALFAVQLPFNIDAIANGGLGRNYIWLTPNIRSYFSMVKERSWDVGFPIPVDAWPY